MSCLPEEVTAANDGTALLSCAEVVSCGEEAEFVFKVVPPGLTWSFGPLYGRCSLGLFGAGACDAEIRLMCLLNMTVGYHGLPAGLGEGETGESACSTGKARPVSLRLSDSLL